MRVVITSLLTIYVLAFSVAQDIEFKIPIKLGTTVNSESEESSVLLSHNGHKLYFTRILETKNSGGLIGGQDIWFCEKYGNVWSEASNEIRNLNNKGNNAVIGMSEDGNILYLLNKYKGRNTSMGVSFSVRGEKGWSVPKSIDVPGLVSNKGFYGFYMEPRGTILIISMISSGSLGKEDLYVSVKNENNIWSNPIHLGNIINSEGFETTPFLSYDERKLYFSSDGHDGFGSADIFVSERLDDSWTNWSKPVNLGEKINSLGFDASFSIWKDSSVYFCSNRSGIMNDIFYSRLMRKETIVKDLDQIINLANNTLVDLGKLMVTVLSKEQIIENIETKKEDETDKIETEEIPSLKEIENIISATEKLANIIPEVIIEKNDETEAITQENEKMNIIMVDAEMNEEKDVIKIENRNTTAEKKSISIEEVAPILELSEVYEEPKKSENELKSETDKDVLSIIKENHESVKLNDDEKDILNSTHLDKHESTQEPIIDDIEKTSIKDDELAQVYPDEEMGLLESTDESEKIEMISRTSLNQVYFNQNSSYLNKSALALLNKLTIKLKEQYSIKLEVLAYADNLGEDQYNLWISERRAMRVIDYLKLQGINENRLSGKWFGENNPIEKCINCTDEQHQINRRVELIMN